MFLFKLLVAFMSVFHSSSENKYLRAYHPGDIMIGGLFPIHQKTNRMSKSGPVDCTDYDKQTFLRTQVMIYAIQEINQRSPRLLANLTLGYDIYDTCGDVSLAIRAALQLLRNQSDPQRCLIPTSFDASLSEPETKVVIGERHSEVSIAIARIFALPSVTQISYGSTSELLSIKQKFPTFLRTVPSDKFQTKAIYELVEYFLWTTVAVVGSDDEYGKYGTDSLLKLFSDNHICVDFVQILPGDFNEDHSRDLVNKINSSTVEAVILFTKNTNVQTIIEEVIKQECKRTWIASDAWSTSNVSKIENIEKIGPVYGFTYKQNDVPGFQDYVNSAFQGSKNAFLTHYQLSQSNSKDDEDCNCTSNSNCLSCNIDRDESYSVYLAVQVIAEGLRTLLKCDNQSCEQTNFTAFELWEKIKEVNITVKNTSIYFDKYGDPSLGYDIMFWNKSKPKGVDITTVGEYWPNKGILFHKDFSPLRQSENVSVFNCFKKCQPGQRLGLGRNRGKCCFVCVDCSSEEYSFGNETICSKCNKGQYSPGTNRSTCKDKTEEFLEWTDPLSIILSTMAAFAIIVTVVIAIVIALNCETPIVKAIGGCLCFVEVTSLVLGFCITFTFIGMPTKHSCSGIHFFGISFSFCISCILANLIQILQGFSFDPRVCSRIKRLNHPVPLIVIISGVQIGVSVAWQIVCPVAPMEIQQNETILHQCDMLKDNRFFVTTIVYNAFWGLVCFVFAFKGRHLPDIYKNASLITVSMVLFLIIWIVCLPIILTLQGKYIPVISSVAILISFYGILGCHLVPKCYIMLFMKEINNQNAISEYIRKHYERKDLPVIPP